MSLIKTIVSRYRSLPPLPFADKMKFAILRSLYKDLTSRKIVDTDCSLMTSRFRKAVVKTDCRCEKLICLCGFGWSGSGAVIDLLDEYENVSAYLEAKDELGERVRFLPEIDIFRTVGGLFDLERVFDSGNIMIRDAALRLFFARVKELYVNTKGMYGDDFLESTREFIADIVDFKSPSRSGYGLCGSCLSGLGRSAEALVLGPCKASGAAGYVYFLKNLSRMEFRSIARRYVNKILSTIPSKKFLVLDQPFSDYEADVERYEEYTGPLKMIAVYRDPRDVFAMKLLHREIDWIPDDVESFVKWYRQCLAKSLKKVHSDFLLLRFEDLVLNYAVTVKRIEEFCGLKSEWHVRPKARFDPSVSIKNVGIHRQFAGSDSMALIERDLKEFIG